MFARCDNQTSSLAQIPNAALWGDGFMYTSFQLETKRRNRWPPWHHRMSRVTMILTWCTYSKKIMRMKSISEPNILQSSNIAIYFSTKTQMTPTSSSVWARSIYKRISIFCWMSELCSVLSMTVSFVRFGRILYRNSAISKFCHNTVVSMFRVIGCKAHRWG